MKDNVDMLKDAVLTVRIPSALKEAVYTAAAADMRTPASLVTKILTEHLRSTGQLAGSAEDATPEGPKQKKRRGR